MKKSLVFAMAMAMGVTASAYAANPFSDVPAGHWAYDSVAKLADAGVVDGYGATFGGEKLMTRYEMAQVVAKAMAKGANVDKLAAEFADELDSLGVRVAKLEKKVDNVKITGQLRYSYKQEDGTGPQNNSNHAFRTRLFVNGEVNKNWSYTGMLVNTHSFKGDGNETVALERAYLNGRIGGVKVLAGHYNEFFMCDTVLDDMVDGVYAEYGVGNGKVYGLAGKNLHKDLSGGTPSDNDRIYVVGVSQKVGPVDLAFNYFNVDSSRGQEIYNINADWAFAKDFGLTARYMWADEKLNKEADKDGWFAQLNYKGADPAVANTWGLRARYFDQSRNVYVHPTYDFYLDGNNDWCGTWGYEGWGFGGDYTFAKNIMWSLDYYDIDSKKGPLTNRTLFSQLWFFF